MSSEVVLVLDSLVNLLNHKNIKTELDQGLALVPICFAGYQESTHLDFISTNRQVERSVSIFRILLIRVSAFIDQIGRGLNLTT